MHGIPPRPLALVTPKRMGRRTMNPWRERTPWSTDSPYRRHASSAKRSDTPDRACTMRASTSARMIFPCHVVRPGKAMLMCALAPGVGWVNGWGGGGRGWWADWGGRVREGMRGKGEPARAAGAPPRCCKVGQSQAHAPVPPEHATPHALCLPPHPHASPAPWQHNPPSPPKEHTAPALSPANQPQQGPPGTHVLHQVLHRLANGTVQRGKVARALVGPVLPHTPDDAAHKPAQAGDLGKVGLRQPLHHAQRAIVAQTWFRFGGGEGEGAGR